MAASALIPLAVQIGAPLVEKILAKKIGAENAELAGDVIRIVANRAGTDVSNIEVMAAEDPATVLSAIQEVERMAPELLALHSAELEVKMALLQAENAAPLWISAWRPLAMYGFGVLWFWNIIGLHVANAIWKVSLPQVDLAVLFQLNALYMALYMGGHTVKDFVSKKWGGSA